MTSAHAFVQDQSGDDVSIGSSLRKSLTESGGVKLQPVAPRSRFMTTILASGQLNEEIHSQIGSAWVLAFLYFKAPWSIDSVRSLLQDRLLEIPRFATVPNLDAKGNTVWLQPSSLDMEALVTEVDWKTPGDIDAFCKTFFQVGLGAESQILPWWRCYVANNMADGRTVLMFAINHAIGDGPSLIASLLAIMDDRETSDAVKAPTKRAVDTPGCFTKIRASLKSCFNVFIGDQLPGDRPNKLKLRNHRYPGFDVGLGFSQSIDLAKVKEVAKHMGGASVNDVLMVVITKVLQAYFQEHDPQVLQKKQSVRANFPISMRKSGADMFEEGNFGNQFVPGTIQFPMHCKEPAEILKAVKRQIDIIKVSPEPVMRKVMTQALVNSGLSAKTILDLALDQYGKVSCMLSNVMGPSEPAYFGGQLIEDLAFYALAPLGLYIGLVSYRGRINCGFAVRSTCEPDVSNLTKLWAPAFEEICAATIGGKTS